MKIEVQSKKGLRTILSVVVDKKTIKQKMDERLSELQKEVSLKGFRPGKVPSAVIKNQFGKSIYGEVIDKVLRETSTKAISEKKLKIAGQPKIDLKQFGEGKDLNYELQIDCLPNIKLKPLNTFKANDYKIKIEKKLIEKKLQEISDQNKRFENKKDHLWHMEFDDNKNELQISNKVQYLEPVITVSSIKKFSKYFRQSLVLELYWENSIDFKKIEKSFENYEKISRIALVRKFFSKVLRNLVR